ncbi:D-serine dehydratase [compost metagenome]
MYSLLALMERSEGLRLEPSALAGLPGIARVQSEQQGYRARMGLDRQTLARATHLAWATGGGMVPPDEMEAYLAKGRRRLAAEA